MRHSSAFFYRSSNHRFWVVPYIHGRLIFAQLAVKAMMKKRFDMLLIDLPGFMNERSWLEAPLASFPLVSSLLIQADDGTCSNYPIVPTDAPWAAAWLAQRHSLEFKCIGPVDFGSSCDEILKLSLLEDERLVMKMGPQSFFNAAWLQLDSIRKDSPPKSIYSLLECGEAVANRISETISSGQKTLFICEYRLWWAVRKALEVNSASGTGNRNNKKDSQVCSCARLLEDPYLLWAAGLFDDYLTVNRRFHESLASGNAGSFDKLAVMVDLIKASSKSSGARDLRADTSCKLATLIRNLKNTTVPSAGANISPARFLEEVAKCFTPESEDALARLFLDYPLPTLFDTAQNPPEYFEISEGKIATTKKWFDLPDVFHAHPYGERHHSETEEASPEGEDFNLMPWLQWVHPFITRQEAKSLGERTSNYRWAVERDYALHRKACSLARELVNSTERPDLMDAEGLGDHTPVVFIFNINSKKPSKYTLVSDNNATRRQMQFKGFEWRPPEDAPDPDSVYSLFAPTRSLETLFEGHIEREIIDSLAILFSGPGMGVERYTAITRQPFQYQCRVRPQEDPSLKEFRHSELGLAWAIKYARKAVIAVAVAGWEPSQAVQNFARKRQKEILMIPLSELPERLTGRLRQLHFISTALKVHPDCRRIVARFVK